MAETDPNPKTIAQELEREMRCNCDLDNWQPEPSTGHSCVCRIHKSAVARYADEVRKRAKARYA